LEKDEVIPKNENGDPEVVDDFHLCNLVVSNCIKVFLELSIFTLIIILVIYIALISAWIEQIADPTVVIINYILQAEAITSGRDISGINTACYLGGIGVCSTTDVTSPQLAILRPSLN
jgi:hypothetical protein